MPVLRNAAAARPTPVHQMRRALGAVRAAYSWGKGGLAFKFTLLALCRRAVELRGRLRAGAHASCDALARRLLAGQPEAARFLRGSRGTPSWYPPQLARAIELLQAERRHLAGGL